jgi:hypothetical protein
MVHRSRTNLVMVPCRMSRQLASGGGDPGALELPGGSD